ncbi:GPO family capsid scaffolding protein [Kingella pumchi]|uniref:GPO family capsid scaffolding protein n=1 Tax=Kingella pumchi TaxID=2779506 RepID=A0ABS9NL41_9NEIS|nr:GPO family capsid scaffolding protein [Kingella pumchi]MCG6503513.1 GPO family capsid scaffolding protein [Kingella pumchi]
MGSKTPTTDWRIIGVSGDTVDGRTISADALRQMAESYDPAVYGARINLEHMSFLFPDYAGGYGDVVELKAAPWPQDAAKTALYARLAVQPALQELWQSGKKIYTSMEIADNFAKTGKAYLVGLAITDTPASLGTTANYSRAALQATAQATTFSTYTESHTMTQPDPQNTPAHDVQTGQQTEQIAEGIFSRLLALFKKTDAQPENPPATSTAPTPDLLPDDTTDYRAEYQAAAELIQKLTDKITAVENQYSELLHKLETEPAAPERPAHTGHTPPSVGW